MKVNEIVVEATNYQNDEVHVDPKTGMPDFSGLKQAAQGAKMLGKGAATVGKAVGKGVGSYAKGWGRAFSNIGKEVVGKSRDANWIEPKAGTTDTTPPMPEPGQQIQVQLALRPGAVKPSFVYKRTNGWVNELGQAITNPATIKELEDLLVGQGGQTMQIPQPTQYKFNKKRGAQK